MPTAVQLQQGHLYPNEILEKLSNWVSCIEPHLKCPLCGDMVTDAHVNPECMHRYCSSCIKHSLLECDDECPKCRASISTHHNLRRDEQFEQIKNAVYEMIKIIRQSKLSLSVSTSSVSIHHHDVSSTNVTTKKRNRTPTSKMKQLKNTQSRNSTENNSKRPKINPTTSNEQANNQSSSKDSTTGVKQRQTRKYRAEPATKPQRDISNDFIWLEQYRQMQEYMKTHSGPTNHVPYQEPYIELSAWCSSQNVNFKRGTKTSGLSLLMQQRRQLLDKINFFPPKKTIEEINEEKWLKMYEELKTFSEKNNGSLDIPKTQTKLDGWCKNQVNIFKRSDIPSKLMHRKELLDQINFFASREKSQKEFKELREKQWLKMFERTKTYGEQNNGSFAISHKHYDTQLFDWIKLQRTTLGNLEKATSSPLYQQRRKMLDQINFFV